MITHSIRCRKKLLEVMEPLRGGEGYHSSPDDELRKALNLQPCCNREKAVALSQWFRYHRTWSALFHGSGLMTVVRDSLERDVKGDCSVETFEVGEQRRLSFRIKVDWPVTLETKSGLVEGKTRDISTGGAHIHCTEYLQLNEPLFLTIKAPDIEPMKVIAVVIWSDSKDKSNQPRVIGVKFTEISLADRKYLEKVALEEFKAKLPQS